MAGTLPDLAGWLIDELAAAIPGVVVSKRRPPDVENQSGPWVRVTCTGGPTDWGGAVWSPSIALEAWHDTSDDAFDLCAAATAALQALEGAITPALHLSAVRLFTACADTPVDGRPVCTTTATTTVAIPI